MRNILDVVKDNEWVHCKTIDEAMEYCKLAHSQGLHWWNGESLIKDNRWMCCTDKTVYSPHRGDFNIVINLNIDVISFEEFKTRLTEGSEVKKTSNVDYDARRYELVKMIIEYVTINSTSDAILGEVFANKVFKTADYIVEQLKRKENE